MGWGMPANITEHVKELGSKMAELYKEIVTTTVKFDELRRYTKESIDEYKRLLERIADKIDRIEREQIKSETELMSKINALEGRLNALSEKALHAAAKEAAETIINRKLLQSAQPQDNCSSQENEGYKKLPEITSTKCEN